MIDSAISLELALLSQKSMQDCDINVKLWSSNSHVEVVGAGRRIMLEDHELDYLLTVYKTLYTNMDISTRQLSRFVTQYKQVQANGLLWGSQNSLSRRSSYILAGWCSMNGKIDGSSVNLRPGLVSYYFKHVISGTPQSTQPVTHIFVCVQWYARHSAQNLFGYPVEVWCSNLFEISGPAQFLPFNRIHSQFIAGFYKMDNGESVLCVCPSISKCYV